MFFVKIIIDKNYNIMYLYDEEGNYILTIRNDFASKKDIHIENRFSDIRSDIDKILFFINNDIESFKEIPYISCNRLYDYFTNSKGCKEVKPLYKVSKGELGKFIKKLNDNGYNLNLDHKTLYLLNK